MIIENHNKIKFNNNFKNKHKGFFNFIDKNNYDIVISDDVVDLENVIKSLSKEEYPYDFDGFFSLEKVKKSVNLYFVLKLLHKNEIVATYAARNIDVYKFINALKNHFNVKNFKEDVDYYLPKNKNFLIKNTYYSSCQWVKTTHRNKNLGVILDHLKKNIIFDLLEGEVNYCIHKELLTDYHKNKLLYEHSEWLMNVPLGNVGGAGDINDKIYHFAWVFKDNWKDIYNQTQLIYEK